MKKRFTNRIEFLALRLLVFVINLLPRPVTLAIGGVSGLLLLKLGVYKKIVCKNMVHTAIASESSVPVLMKKLYKNMGRYASDFLRTGLQPPCRVNNYELVQAALARGKGAVVLLGHYGNWELLADLFGREVANLHVVAKPMRNSLVDNWLAQKRASASVTTIYTHNALRRMMEVIRKNGIVAILIDQFVGVQGTMVPFLGRDANTTRAVAGIVRKTGCAVLPTHALLRDDGSYDITISDAPVPRIDGLDDSGAIRAYQVQHNDILSSWIRNEPEHWFGWFHKRYRGSIRYR